MQHQFDIHNSGQVPKQNTPSESGGGWHAGDDGSEHDAMTVWVDDWDVGAPWLPWATYSDPIGKAPMDLSDLVVQPNPSLPAQEE